MYYVLLASIYIAHSTFTVMLDSMVGTQWEEGRAGDGAMFEHIPAVRKRRGNSALR